MRFAVFGFFVISLFVTSACTKFTSTRGEKAPLEAFLSGDGSVVQSYHFANSAPDSDWVITLANSSQFPMTNMDVALSDSSIHFKGAAFPGVGGTCATTLAPQSKCTLVFTRAVSSVSSVKNWVRKAQDDAGLIEIRVVIGFIQNGQRHSNTIVISVPKDSSTGGGSTSSLVPSGSTPLPSPTSNPSLPNQIPSPSPTPTPTPEVCQLKIGGECPFHPEFNSFEGPDHWGMENLHSGTDPGVCAKRANDYYSWCGSASSVQTTFLASGKVTEANAICSVKIAGQCHLHPTIDSYNGPDVWGMQNQNTGNDPKTCAQRANEYYTWCGSITPVQTTFHISGQVTEANAICNVQIVGECRLQPAYSNFSGPDVWGMQNKNAGNDPAGCAQRAYDYSGWCGYSARIITTFKQTGAVTNVEPLPAPDRLFYATKRDSYVAFGRLYSFNFHGITNYHTGALETKIMGKGYSVPRGVCNVPLVVHSYTRDQLGCVAGSLYCYYRRISVRYMDSNPALAPDHAASLNIANLANTIVGYGCPVGAVQGTVPVYSQSFDVNLNYISYASYIDYLAELGTVPWEMNGAAPNRLIPNNLSIFPP